MQTLPRTSFSIYSQISPIRRPVSRRCGQDQWPSPARAGRVPLVQHSAHGGGSSTPSSRTVLISGEYSITSGWSLGYPASPRHAGRFCRKTVTRRWARALRSSRTGTWRLKRQPTLSLTSVSMGEGEKQRRKCAARKGCACGGHKPPWPERLGLWVAASPEYARSKGAWWSKTFAIHTFDRWLELLSAHHRGDVQSPARRAWRHH